MIFRVINNKLYQVKSTIDNEDEFIQKNKSLNFIKVNPQDLPSTDIETDEVFYELDANGNIIVDIQRTQERALEYFKEQQNKILQSLLDLCDKKTQEVLNTLYGQPITQTQLERYKQKEQMAKAYLTDGSYANELQIEADLAGMTVSDFANLIIKKANDFYAKANYYIALIEAFRVKTKNLILNAQSINDLYKIQAIIDKAATLDANATPDQIKALFV